MEPDREELKSARQIAGTQQQLIGDLEHLRQLRNGILRTQDVLLRAAKAYEASQKLLLEGSPIRQIALNGRSMGSPEKAIEHAIKLGKQHVAEQEARIDRQKQLIASLEADGHAQLSQRARQLLTEMCDILERMRDDLAQARDRLDDRR